jgi:hypothetical protein
VAEQSGVPLKQVYAAAVRAAPVESAISGEAAGLAEE